MPTIDKSWKPCPKGGEGRLSLTVFATSVEQLHPKCSCGTEAMQCRNHPSESSNGKERHGPALVSMRLLSELQYPLECADRHSSERALIGNASFTSRPERNPMTTAKQLARQRAKEHLKAEKARIAKNDCSTDGCDNKAKVEYACIACEHLKKKKPYVQYACSQHSAVAATATKKHTLTKHPVNLLRAIAAGLAGEEVF